MINQWFNLLQLSCINNKMNVKRNYSKGKIVINNYKKNKRKPNSYYYFNFYFDFPSTKGGSRPL